ncbi:hypothetical protein TTHERM_00016470 (macronuclear) [Tetrahymena thermophila SB210]|uniref:Uncharacterized protein n=1 Tax=Tetrahymena thermophila (strain SB210) TaxID=312017 RepID=Q22RE1_TETTS|nr:hypothetical protein TTHERM_00016470 [Tetrahymena thermophila SB210]EAR88181.2 hypothetical protein TTHERM_00016470 [Tetrahymena thermophila SB210]|eukprot:XP_001008426.2 hypothetical protein TTHERM_00016470 [Tetrahymena thermophila SB210]
MGKQELKAIECDTEKDQQKEEEVQEQNKKVVSSRKNIRKAKWKYRCVMYPTIQQNFCFYLYGSLILHSDYNPVNVFSSDTMDLIQRHQQVESVIINKQVGAIEIKYNIISPGILDFAFLVKHFENKQLQSFYNFAQSLKDFKIFVDVINQKIIDKKKILNKMPKVLDIMDQQYFQFEKWANDLIEKHFKDEFFSYSLYQSNYRKGYAELKKQVSSHNTISLYGQSISDVYEAEICKMKNKSVQFEKYQDFNIDLLMECLTFIIGANASQQSFQKKNLQMSTIEGFQLPVTIEIYKLKFYDYKKNDPNFHFVSEYDYMMIINVVKVDDLWLKRLIDIRKELENYKKPNNQPFMIEASQEFNHINSLLFKEEDNEILRTVKKNNSFNHMQFESFEDAMDSSYKVNEGLISSSHISSVGVKSDNETINTDTCEYFTPEVIDLAGNKEHQEYLNKQIMQLQQKDQIAQNLNTFFQLKQQEIELSNIEYSCQVEYFLDKFYSSDKEDQKQCQFKVV